jgi:hypothetical protein
VTTSTLILDFEHLSMKKLTSKIGNAARSWFFVFLYPLLL